MRSSSCPVSLGLGLTGVAGPVYLAAAVVLNLLFVQAAFAVWRRTRDAAEADRWGVEKRLFKLSLLYLFLHFGALLAEAALGTQGGPDMAIRVEHEIHERRRGRNYGVLLLLLG
jgi:heme O synthase-like polyprenyltransferase